MIDPLDPHTKALDLGASMPALAEQREEAAPGVPSIARARADARLAEEFELVRITAPVYVQDKKAAAARTAGAERVARHRQKQADEGRRPATVPIAVLDQVKALGGWEKWQAQIAAAAVPPEPQIIEKRVEVEKRADVPGPERIVEKVMKVPAKLSKSDLEALEIGKKTQALTGWKAVALRWLIT